MNLGLHYHPNSPNGPGKVAINLIRGLEKNGITVCHNQTMNINGCLQSWGVPQYRNLPSNTLMGPNLMVLPSEDSDVWQKYNDFIVPSRWVLDKYNSFEETKGCNLHIWPVGIDTEKFAPNKDIKYDCLIYFKNRDIQELENILQTVEEKKLTYRVLQYGKYEEKELIDACNSCRFAILHTNTESQGIAYMEILSMNVPCFVYDTPMWQGFGKQFPATSVPYFDDSCGEKTDFASFLNNLDKYTPREYIINNHTLEKSAEKYVQIIRETHLCPSS